MSSSRPSASLRLTRAIALALTLSTAPAALLQAQDIDRGVVEPRIQRQMEEVRDTIGNRVVFNGNAAELEEMLERYAQVFTAAELQAFRTQLAQHQAAHHQLAVAEDLERLGGSVSELETQWTETQATLADAETSPNSRDAAIQDMERTIDGLQRQLGELPAEAVGALTQRVAAVQADFTAKVGAAESAERLTELRGYWQRDLDGTEDWQSEQGVDFATYKSTQSASVSALGLPHTLARFEEAASWLKRFDDDMADAPAVFRLEVKKVHAETRARLLKQAQALVAAGKAASAEDEPSRSAMNRLDESLRLNLAAESDADFGALKTQTAQWLEAAALADTSSEEGRAQYYKRMSVSAKAAWPAMLAQYASAGSFDPTDDSTPEGTLIRIETDNLMGWRFKVGDFPFATTINGVPVAGIYHPEVAAAIAEVEGKMGRALGDSDDDGRWTVIAEVTGKRGQMQKRVQHDGDLRTESGEKVGTWSGESAETTEAPIIRIVAAYVGPLAVAKGIGVARADGSLQASTAAGGDQTAAAVGAPLAGSPVGGSGSGSGSGSGAGVGAWLMRGLVLLFGLVGATASVLQARPALAAGGAQRVGPAAPSALSALRPHLFAVGIALILFGAYWLLRGMVYLDLLPALALMASGLVAAGPDLARRGLLPAHLNTKIAAFALPIAGGTALTAVLHLLVGGWPLL